jgi:flagellar hook-basal body complex protein FliE
MDPLNLNPLSPLKPLADLGQTGSEGAAEGPVFSDILKQALQEVDAAQHTAEQEVRNLMTGESTDMHTAILAVQKADVSFQMMMAVRGKLIDAYREVMRMQM